MTDAERIDYLIKSLEGDNARRFADRTGIRTDTLSRARNGIGRPSVCFQKILDAYPQVRRNWLLKDEGEPFSGEEEKSLLLRKVEALEKEVKRLTKALNQIYAFMVQEAINSSDKK